MIFIMPLIANIWVHWVFSRLKIWLIKHISGIPAEMKPFDCESCLSFWVVLMLYYKCDYIWQGILLGGLAYFIAKIYSFFFVKYLNKLYIKWITKK